MSEQNPRDHARAGEKTFFLRSLKLKACRAILLLGLIAPIVAQTTSSTSWTGTWATAAMRNDSKKTFNHQTLRQIIHTSVAGTQARIHISNLFGEQPLQIEDIHLALRSSESSIVDGSDRQLRFQGHISVTIPPGASAVSDPISFTVPALADIAVSFYLPNETPQSTFHPSAHKTSYLAAGDISGRIDLPEASTFGGNYFLTNLDVQGKDLRGAVATLGASITEGYTATDNSNRRWPDILAERLAEAGINVGILNQGISGNRLLTDGAGASALHRFDRDVLDQPGIRWVILSDEPINDLGSTKPPPTASDLISAVRELIAKAHEKQIRFFCSTLTPYQRANYWAPEQEITREQFNAFVRDGKSGCDAVIDQDRATHDPDHPTQYLPAYDVGDHLHPNDAGHEAIANAIDLSLFERVVPRHKSKPRDR